MDYLTAFLIQKLNCGNQVSIRGGENGNLIRVFPSEADHIGDNRAVNALLDCSRKVRTAFRPGAIWYGMMAGRAKGRIFRVARVADNLNSRLPIQPCREPIMVLPAFGGFRIIRCVNDGALETIGGQTS